jgi:hypothetical protein
MILPYSAKTLNFFVATSAVRLLTAKLKDFAFPFGDAVIARCSLASAPGGLRGALFHNARSLRCAQNAFANISNWRKVSRRYLPGLRRSGDCACPPAHTPSLFVGDVIICAVLAVLSAVPIPRSYSESRTPRSGCADHHVIGFIADA